VEKLKNQLFARIILLLIAVILVAFGASALVKSGIGGDAVLVFEQGVSVFLNIEFGIMIMIINSLMMIILFFVNRKMISIGTFVFIFILGPLVSLFDRIPIFLSPETFPESLLIFSVGALFATFGVSLYLYTDVGYTAFEGILIEIKNRSNIRFAYIKIINDAILFVAGILLGGTFGWGSVISIFLFGPLIDGFVMLFKKSNILKPKQL
jgi:uncharacterized membrane protein YczE